MHPTNGLTMFPEGKKGDLDDAGTGNYDPPLDTIKLYLSATGYRVEIIGKNWRFFSDFRGREMWQGNGCWKI
jgi:hypothetical protein